jgi:uncharacterized protein YbjT (DUF2867 family)
MNLLILGASGGCGQWLVRLARERGHQVRALVRPATPFNPPAGIEVLRGEVLEAGVLERALAGCEVVLSALGIQRKTPWNPWSALASPPDLATQVARRLGAAMPGHGVRRVVAISAGGVGESVRQLHPLIRWLIAHSNLAASYRDLEGMEAVFAGSGLDWLAVRPTTLRAGPPSGAVQVVRHFGLFSRTARGDVAAWMLAAAERPEPFTERTPMIATADRWRRQGPWSAKANPGASPGGSRATAPARRSIR